MPRIIKVKSAYADEIANAVKFLLSAKVKSDGSRAKGMPRIMQAVRLDLLTQKPAYKAINKQKHQKAG